MRAELEAGSSYVIAEARKLVMWVYTAEAERWGGLVQEILTQIPADKIIYRKHPRKRSSCIS